MQPGSEASNSDNWLLQAAERGPVMVVAAHPDDESLAVGGHLADWSEVYVIHVTDGAPQFCPDRDAYAATRRREVCDAMAIAGVHSERIIGLGAVDQQAAHSLLRLSLTLNRLLLGIHPALVLCHPYEGGHPDHDSAAFLVQAALSLAELETPGPVVAEYTSYHNAPPFQSTELRTGHFLPDSDNELEIELSPQQQQTKRRMLGCFVTQRDMISNFSLSPERFRLAPKYDFSRPPHEGFLYYDQQGWGVHSSEWRRLAANAEADLRRCTCSFAPAPSIW